MQRVGQIISGVITRLCSAGSGSGTRNNCKTETVDFTKPYETIFQTHTIYNRFNSTYTDFKKKYNNNTINTNDNKCKRLCEV